MNFLTRVLKIISNIKFHQNPSSGSQDVPGGRTEGMTERETTKLTVGFRNFAYAPNKCFTRAQHICPSEKLLLKFCSILSVTKFAELSEKAAASVLSLLPRNGGSTSYESSVHSKTLLQSTRRPKLTLR